MFTALTAQYEQLNELTIERPAGVEFVCFTDDPTLTSETWQLVVVPAAFDQDPIRSQRMLKILGHQALDGYDEWLYVDNSVRLRVDPNEILDDWLTTADLAFPSNPVSDTLQREFDIVLGLGYDSRERVTEQLDHYRRSFPALLEQRPYWCGMFARRNTRAVATTMELWFRHVLRYSRRDQLSINLALAGSEANINRVELDIWGSDLHEWPVAVERRIDIKLDRPHDHLEDLERCTAEAERLRDRLAMVEASTSWRITGPVRRLGELLRRRV